MSVNAKKGFTLIELVVVILLLAIISTVAATRFSGRQSYEIFALQELAVSVIRQVQVNRMQSNMAPGVNEDNFTLSVTSNCIGSVEACSAPTNDSRSDLVTADDYQFSVTGGDSSVSFSLLGNPQELVLPVTITLSSTSSGESGLVCINEQGFVFSARGTCA